MTTVTVEYDCPARCRYEVPTTLRGGQSVLHQPALVDTLAVLADVAHERDCPVGDPDGRSC